MHTHTNVVRSGFLNCALTSEIVSLVSFNFFIMSSEFAPAPISEFSMGPNLPEISAILPRAFSSTLGKLRKRRVWPVGAVSNTMVSNDVDLTCFMTSANDMASSTPGIDSAMSWNMLLSPAPLLPACSTSSCMLPLGSISMQWRFGIPSTGRASLPNFCPNASDRLCAGSVEIRSTDLRCLASCTASEHDVVVLPTPPLPPQKIHRSDRWSMMFWRVGSSWKSSDIDVSRCVYR